MSCIQYSLTCDLATGNGLVSQALTPSKVILCTQQTGLKALIFEAKESVSLAMALLECRFFLLYTQVSSHHRWGPLQRTKANFTCRRQNSFFVLKKPNLGDTDICE